VSVYHIRFCNTHFRWFLIIQQLTVPNKIQLIINFNKIDFLLRVECYDLCEAKILVKCTQVGGVSGPCHQYEL